MAEPPAHSDIGEDAGGESPRGPTSGSARWQKVVGIIGFVVVVVLAIMLFAGGGHRPGRHGALSPVAGDAVEMAVTGDGEAATAADWK